jgi:hypothetical protein
MYDAETCAALGGTSEDLQSFLISNRLWGGSGSIADQAGIGPSWTQSGVAALIDLGEEQIRQGLVNQRTEQWVRAFKSWRQPDI